MLWWHFHPLLGAKTWFLGENFTWFCAKTCDFWCKNPLFSVQIQHGFGAKTNPSECKNLRATRERLWNCGLTAIWFFALKCLHSDGFVFAPKPCWICTQNKGFLHQELQVFALKTSENFTKKSCFCTKRGWTFHHKMWHFQSSVWKFRLVWVQKQTKTVKISPISVKKPVKFSPVFTCFCTTRCQNRWNFRLFLHLFLHSQVQK